MIVIGTDTHKDTHTRGSGACEQRPGGRRADPLPHASAASPGTSTGPVSLDPERVWAIEDCRHVSGGLERFLVAAGERVVRVPPKLMGARSTQGLTPAAGKSDPIDAVNVAGRRCGGRSESLPAAFLDEEAMEIKLLLDHRENLVQRSQQQTKGACVGTCTSSLPNSRFPLAALDRMRLARASRRPPLSTPPGARVRVSPPRAAALDSRPGTRRAKGARARDRRLWSRARPPSSSPCPAAGR